MTENEIRYRTLSSIFQLCIVVAMIVATLGFPLSAEAATYVVNSRWDEDDGECDASHCSLREAINAANEHPGGDTIWFNYESGSPDYFIRLSDELPDVEDSGLVIDGTTMPTWEESPSVVIVGSDEITHGLRIDADGVTVRGLEFSNFTGGDNGTGIIVSSNDNLIEFVQVIVNERGILLSGDNNTVQDSFIGLAPRGYDRGNTGHGIQIRGDENLITNTAIAFNDGAGIYIAPGSSYHHNTFTQNSIYDNGELGIEIGDNNDNIDAPMIASMSTTEVSGEACRDCTVEVYLADPDPTDYGEGADFLGEANTGDSRSFSIAFDGEIDDCDYVTATATSMSGNTSEFSLNDRPSSCIAFETSIFPEPYLTVNTEDDLDDGDCNEEHCSLREAINEANTYLGDDTISFDIPGDGPHRIELTRSLPPLTDDQTTIDATTEPHHSDDHGITLDGRVAEVEVGFLVESQRNVIRGFFISNFGDIEMHGGWPYPVGGAIVLEGGLNRIEDNQIAFNTGHGIIVDSDYNTITGNVIGLDEDGLASWDNHGHGIHVLFTSDFNTIGGAEPGEGNIIAGNHGHGINVHYSEGNRIIGNIIGSNMRGEVSIPNERSGIYTQGSGEIGGLNPGEGNIVVGNSEHGIVLWDTASDVTVAGNTIHDNEEAGIYVDLYTSPIEYVLTRNSIYDNGALGIDSYNQTAEDHFLRIDSASTTTVSGIACRGCLVEVFLAEPDPSGAGEGRTYLGEDRADVAGVWNVSVSDVEVCDAITATSTKSGEGTSEFAENAYASCVGMPSPWFFGVSIFTLLFGTILVAVGRTARAEGPGWGSAAAFGALFSAGISLLLVLIPNVQVDFSATDERLPDLRPDCVDFIDPQSISPADGHVFGTEEDPLLAWQVTGELPEGEYRWRVDLRAPDQRLYSETSETNELVFSAFGLAPRHGGRYDWYLSGELKSGAAESFEPFCNGQTAHVFKFVNPLIEERMQAEETEPEDETCTPSVTATTNVTCRLGPNKVFEDEGYLHEGESAPALAQTQGAGWFQILLNNEDLCWVWSGAVTAECSDDLQILEGPPLPTATPTSEPLSDLPIVEEPPLPTATPTSEPVDEENPPAPNTLSPKNGETKGCAASVPLQWSAVDDPSGIAAYIIQVEQGLTWVPAPGSPFTRTSTALDFEVNCGAFYRWRVRAKDGAGNTGAWSAWSEFDVILP